MDLSLTSLADMLLQQKRERPGAFTQRLWDESLRSMLSRYEIDGRPVDIVTCNEFLDKRNSGCQLAVRAICEQAIEPDRLPPSLEMYQSNSHVALDALVAAERLYRAGRFQDAIVHLRNAMRSGYRFPAVANNLACLILETSDDEHELHEALRFSCWAVQQEPRVATYLETLGRIHLRLGHCEESLFWLRFARRLNPECRVDAWIQLALGVMGKT